jgi:uncharacterized protein (TIGR03437 family)
MDYILRIVLFGAVPAFSSGAQTLKWTFNGPYSAAGTSAGITSGRVSAVLVDPRNANTIYAAGAQGGVWKSTDGGNTWTPLTDNQPTLAIGSLAFDPSNPDIIYAGTGEETLARYIDIEAAYGGSYYGAGVLKSTDRGATWTLNPGPFAGPFGPTFFDGGARIGSIAVQPTNGQVLLLSADLNNPTKSGIYRSTDGGVTWTLVLAGASGTEALFDPSNGNTAYAALGNPAGDPANGIYKSQDGGVTWTRIPGSGSNVLPTANVGRIRVAMAPTNPSILYTGIENISNTTALGIWKSTDGGASWVKLVNAPDYCRDSCFYHNVLRVSPVDANVVIAGGIGPYRSLDGGTSWASIFQSSVSGQSIHPDLHALAFTADGKTLYVGCDGGVYSASNLTATPVTWVSRNTNLGLTQFYQGISIHPNDPTITYGGSQDNGTLKSGTPQWQAIGCGDGGRTLIDPAHPATVYFTCSGGPPLKSTNGSNFFDGSSGIMQERTSFSAPFAMDPANPQRLYYGTYRVYVSNDGAGSWTPISPDLTRPGLIVGITTITVAPSNSNIVYTACGNDNVQPKVTVSTNALSGTSSTWTDRSAGLPPRMPSQIVVDRSNPQIAFMGSLGFSGFNGDTAGHVFRTTTGGASWTDVSGNLPNTQVQDLLLDPNLPQTVYAATDQGVFWTLDNGAHWTQLGVGLPRMAVISLAMHQPSRTLRAATYGRSMWDLKIPLPSPVVANGGIVNGAWPVSGAPLAPGSIATLFGTSLALDALSTGAPWPFTLAGASVSINANQAAIYYAGPGQINFQVPWEQAGSTLAAVTVTTGGNQASGGNIKLAPYAPGLFTTNQQGSGQAAALVAGTAIIAAPAGMFPGSRPVKRGEYLELYGTGLGPVTNTPATGAPAPVSPLAQTTVPAAVTIGGMTGQVFYSGLSPNFVGLYQVDVLVPANAPVGPAVPVSVTIGGMTSNIATVAVQ